MRHKQIQIEKELPYNSPAGTLWEYRTSHEYFVFLLLDGFVLQDSEKYRRAVLLCREMQWCNFVIGEILTFAKRSPMGEYSQKLLE